MSQPASRILSSSLVVLLLIAVGVGTYWLQPRDPSSAPISKAAPLPPAPAIAQVTNAARSLKLITWSFDTTLDAHVVSDRWYGDATAEVRAPVRYQYGLDLTTLDADDAIFDVPNGRYVFIVDAPQRLSVEVDLEKLEESLHVSGLRWRSRNADQLEEARRILGARAKELKLSDEDEKRLREVSREQLERHLGSVLAGVAPDAKVLVRFAE